MLKNGGEHKEIVVTGKEGQGKTHAVVNVGIKLQNNNDYKCVLVDMRKVFNDFCTAKAVDIMKTVLPSSSLVDMLGILYHYF